MTKEERGMHIHLDAVGGIAGDMFVAALLDARPDLSEAVQDNLRLAGLQDDVHATILPHDDGVLTGSRFDVRKTGSEQGHPEAHSHSHAHEHRHGHDHPHHDHAHNHHHHDDVRHHHHHTHWRDLRAMLESSKLPEEVKRIAVAIFQELAQAEAAVHGKEVDDVAFHEVGNWDSIADIVAAATLIEAMGAGLPVLGVRSPGVGDTVTDGVTGFLSSEDASAFAVKMTRLASERELRKQMGAAAREDSTKYAIERTTRIMLRYYEGLVRAAQPRHRGLRFRLRSFMERFNQ